MDPFIGEIRMFAGNYAPVGWANCDGSLLPISQYNALFALLGVSYGGNGSSTFGLPDLRGRAPICAGSGPNRTPYSVGDAAGSEKVVLNAQQMPTHTHTVNVNTTSPTAGLATNAFLGLNVNTETGDAIPFYSATATEGSTLNPAALTAAGGNQPFSVVQPVLAVTFIIALQGIWPSRP